MNIPAGLAQSVRDRMPDLSGLGAGIGGGIPGMMPLQLSASSSASSKGDQSGISWGGIGTGAWTLQLGGSGTAYQSAPASNPTDPGNMLIMAAIALAAVWLLK